MLIEDAIEISVGREGLEPPEPVNANDLQSFPLPITVYLPIYLSVFERKTGLEPAISTMARSYSTN